MFHLCRYDKYSACQDFLVKIAPTPFLPPNLLIVPSLWCPPASPLVKPSFL